MTATEDAYLLDNWLDDEAQTQDDLTLIESLRF